MNKTLLVLISFFAIAIALCLILVLSGVVNITPPEPITCVVAGCSSELCINQDDSHDKGISMCIWTNKYACYQKTRCEVQSTGKCGWTETEEFNTCLLETDNVLDIITR